MSEEYLDIDFGVSTGKANYEQEQRQAERPSDFVKLKEGSTVLRVLPALLGEAAPFQVYTQHALRYQTEGNNGQMMSSFRSLVCGGDDCDFCGMVEQAVKANPSFANAAKRLTQRRVIARVIDRKDIWSGGQLPPILKWDMPPTLYADIVTARKARDEELLAQDVTDDRLRDITHPIYGFDVVVNRKGKGQQDTEYSVVLQTQRKPLLWVPNADPKAKKVADIEAIKALIGEHKEKFSFAQLTAPSDLDTVQKALQDPCSFDLSRLLSGEGPQRQLGSGGQRGPKMNAALRNAAGGGVIDE